MFLMVVAIVCLIMHSCNLKTKIDTEEQNLKAMRDTIHNVRMENDELLQYKSAYLITTKDYEEYIGMSEGRIKELERALKGKIDEIALLKGNVRIDTLLCHDSVYIKDDSVFITFRYGDEWMTLAGSTKMENNIACTIIDSVRIDVPLTLGYTDKNDFFVTSENPYVSFSSINSARSPKSDKTHKSIGLQVGLGLVGGYGYGAGTGGAGTGLGVGVGIYVGFGFGYGKNF